MRPPGQAAALAGRTVAREAVANWESSTLVAAHSRALSAVSRDIAAAIRQACAQ
ncbi:hypothetical protein [Paraburkholderia fungorum]|uniref:hypothetical protein n=1 Tax=Paraburkholderia fungorum TaxID=134537 RepID=UPI0038BE174E